ncbi:cyclase [Rubrobacter tropicus]|uniref:Cyclase n=1 Tax=Rubrobacter tropicus TaxID=2653851 RepID=A0A6G8QAD9_9ACTN|nr:SRPBCC family protein [Rubrobacter tropicus]QIN83450.1 cyclase [Rubrobacter tropicus]
MAEPITGSIEVEAPVAKVYEYWRDLENLPSFMKNIEEVRSTGPDTTHWVVKGPLGYRAEFDARTTQDEPNSAIGWNTLDGDVQTSGQVRFQEVTPNRTRLEVQMKYADPPAGKLGEAASRLTSGPKAIMEQDLRNFKDIIEGKATPEEVQQRPAAADAHSGAIATLTSGTGLLVIGGVVVLWLLLRRGGSSGGRGKSRIIFEF